MSNKSDYTLDIDTELSFKDSVEAWLHANNLIANDSSIAPIKIQRRTITEEDGLSYTTVKEILY